MHTTHTCEGDTLLLCSQSSLLASMMKTSHLPPHAYIWRVNKGFAWRGMEEYFDALVRIDQGLVSRTIKTSDMITSDDDMDAFVRKTSVVSSANTNADPPVCAICLEEIKVGELVPFTACKHEFHARCMWDWVQQQCHRGRCCKCPVCNFILFAPVMNSEKPAQTRPHARRVCQCSCM